jgi:hypothetical protein
MAQRHRHGKAWADVEPLTDKPATIYGWPWLVYGALIALALLWWLV